MTDDAAPSRDALRSRRLRNVRATTIATRSITKRSLKVGGVLYPYPDGVVRPRTRGDCVDAPRPCLWVSCRWHLYLDIDEDRGSIKLNFPDLEPGELTETCALDVADRGPATLEEVGALVNVTRERIRQIEVRAEALLARKRMVRELAAELPKSAPPRVPREPRPSTPEPAPTPRPPAMHPSMRAGRAVLPIADVRRDLDFFLCRPYAETITARTCLSRLTASRRDDPRLPQDGFRACKTCVDGVTVASRIAPLPPLPPPKRWGGGFTARPRAQETPMPDAALHVVAVVPLDAPPSEVELGHRARLRGPTCSSTRKGQLLLRHPVEGELPRADPVEA